MIEKMKFLSITGPKADIDRVVDTYLSRYEIHLENALSELKTVRDLRHCLLYTSNYLYRRKYTGIRYTEGLKLPRSDDDQIVPLLASEVYRIDRIFDEEKQGEMCIRDRHLKSFNRSLTVNLMCLTSWSIYSRIRGERFRIRRQCSKCRRRTACGLQSMKII